MATNQTVIEQKVNYTFLLIKTNFNYFFAFAKHGQRLF